VPLKDDITIVCVGNGLAGDDRLGEAVYERLRKDRNHADTQLVLLGLGGLALLEHLHAQRLMLVIDAVQLGGSPGTIHVLNAEDIPTSAAQAVSLHGIGLQDALSVAHVLYPERVPSHAILIGVEGDCFNELGAPLSKAVEEAIEKVLEEINRRIALYLLCEAAPTTGCAVCSNGND
jgi:hydrogenase maturation protease